MEYGRMSRQYQDECRADDQAWQMRILDAQLRIVDPEIRHAALYGQPNHWRNGMKIDAANGPRQDYPWLKVPEAQLSVRHSLDRLPHQFCNPGPLQMSAVQASSE